MTTDEELYQDPNYYWVIETEEKIPRYIEVILARDYKMGYAREYGLVPNINYAKVWLGKPVKALRNFIKETGIEAHIRKAHKRAYDHYQDYEAYFNGKRELTMQEKIEIKEDWEQWRREHDPIENQKSKDYYLWH